LFRSTIYEPEEATNRFRKYLWALSYSPIHSQTQLKKISQVESDPAKLLVSLYGGLQSNIEDILKQVKSIAVKNTNRNASELLQQRLLEIRESADYMINDLRKK
jgi:hypothetical protein